MSEFAVGQIVQYRDWGWVTTPTGREWGHIWRDVEVLAVHPVKARVKHADGRTGFVHLKNLRSQPPMLAAVPTEYIYLCMNRPPLWETVPDGYTGTRPHPDSEYGVVTYDKPLTLQERYKYQLRLVSPMFEPVKGLKVRFIFRGTVCEDVLDCPHERLGDFWYTENEGHVRLADMEVIE